MAIQEEWREIENENYEVSNLGRVRSLDKLVNGYGGKKLKKGKVLKSSLGSSGYLLVNLSVSKNIHRLVAEAFVKGDVNLTVNHIDGNKLNNNYSNLEWITHREQNLHAIEFNLCNHGSKVKVIEMMKDNIVIAEYRSMREAALKIGGGHQSISKCCNGKKKIYKGYSWRFKK